MEKTVGIKVEVDSKNAQKSLGQLEEDFEKLNQQIREVPINSKEFKELNAQLAQAGREIKNLELGMESLDNEQVASELGSVAGAVGDVSAAFILLGDDSETMQEVAKNIEFAMGLSMGLKGAIEGVSSANKLLTNSQMAQNVVQNLTLQGMKKNIAALFGKTAATTADTAATAGATTATGFFGTALNLLPIFAIITGLTLLVVFFDKVKGAMMAVGNYIYEMFKPQIDIVVDALQFLGIIESDEEAARKKRESEALKARKKATEDKINLINSEIEANKKLTAEMTSAIDFEIAKKQAAGEDFNALEKEKIQLMIASTKKQIDLINAKIDARQKEIDQDESLLQWDAAVAKAKIEGQKKIRDEQQANFDKLTQDLEIFEIKQTKIKSDAIKKASDEKAKANEKIADDDKKAAEKKAEDDKKAAEEALKEQQRLIDKAYNLKLEAILKEEAAAESYRVRQLTDEQKALEDLSNRYFQEQDAFKNNEEMLLILKAEYEAEAAKIEADFEEQRQQAKRDKRDKDLQSVSTFNQSLIGLNNAVLEAQLEGEKGNEAKQEEFRKKAFERNKKLQIAQATIDGIGAVISTFRSTPGGLILKSIAAGIAGVTALANIKKIASTSYAGSSGGSTPSSLGNTSAGSTGANVGQVTNTTTTIGEPTRVYVTEQDISNTQNKVSVNEAQATVG